MKKAFLGGTCNDSTWRDELIQLAKDQGLEIDFFNPVVPDWTPDCQARELKARANSDFVIYVLTPRMTGFYSVAEVVDDSNKRPDKVIFCVLAEDYEYPNLKEMIGNDDDCAKKILKFTPDKIKSLVATLQLVVANGGTYCADLNGIIEHLKEKQ